MKTVFTVWYNHDIVENGMVVPKTELKRIFSDEDCAKAFVKAAEPLLPEYNWRGHRLFKALAISERSIDDCDISDVKTW